MLNIINVSGRLKSIVKAMKVNREPNLNADGVIILEPLHVNNE